MRKLFIVVGFLFLFLGFLKSQTDSDCDLMIRASSDSIIYKVISLIDSIDSNDLNQLITKEKEIAYLQVDSIIYGNYSEKFILVESGPLISHMLSEKVGTGKIISRLLTGSGAHRISYNKHIFRLKKLNDRYFKCE